MKYNILIVDDEYSVTFALVNIITMQGYNVLAASTAKEALEVIRNNNIDLAFFDVKLPGMDGIELLKEVRKFNTSMPVIMMTAYTNSELIERTVKESLSICLRKPFEVPEVLDLLNKLIKK